MMSTVVPIFVVLFSHIEHEVIAAGDVDPIKMASAAAHSILSMYDSVADDCCFDLPSVIVDPRFQHACVELKEFRFLYPGLISSTVTLLEKSVNDKRIHCDGGGQHAARNIPAHQQHTALLSMCPHCAAGNDTQDEVEQYLALRCADPSVDPLDCWNAHAQ